MTAQTITATIDRNGVEYTAELADGWVTIYRDSVWSGTGRWSTGGDDRGQIADCAADLGDEVYEALDEALADAIDDSEDEEETAEPTTYSVEDGNGNGLADGLQEHEADAAAQRIADRIGAPVYLHGGTRRIRRYRPQS